MVSSCYTLLCANGLSLSLSIAMIILAVCSCWVAHLEGIARAGGSAQWVAICAKTHIYSCVGGKCRRITKQNREGRLITVCTKSDKARLWIPASTQTMFVWFVLTRLTVSKDNDRVKQKAVMKADLRTVQRWIIAFDCQTSSQCGILIENWKGISQTAEGEATLNNVCLDVLLFDVIGRKLAEILGISGNVSNGKLVFCVKGIVSVVWIMYKNTHRISSNANSIGLYCGPWGNTAQILCGHRGQQLGVQWGHLQRPAVIHRCVVRRKKINGLNCSITARLRRCGVEAHGSQWTQ